MNNWELFAINLQLFADEGTGEKSEKATPRRREEAKKKGQVFKSADLSAAVILIAGSAAMYFSFPSMAKNLEDFTSFYLLNRTLEDFDVAYASLLFMEAGLLMAKTLLPVFLATFVAALLVSYLQVGFVLSGESLSPKLSRINPLEGFKRIFSKRALVEFVKSMLKVIITAYIVYSVVKTKMFMLPLLVDMSLRDMIGSIGAIIFEMAMKVGLVFIIIGIIDYIYQWYEHEKSLMMSKYDIKQEYKQTEGDPLIKSKQRQIQREAAMKRMMAEVPHADVVITNPTHFAVVLKYSTETMGAPVLVAKGQDYVAQKIREIAEANNVIIVQNPPLARTLFHTLEIGQEVPEELYQAVAEVLAFVYKQKKVAFK